MKSLDGTWIPITAELNGQPMPDQVVSSMRLILQGKAYEAHVGGVADKGEFSVNESAVPKTMDILGVQGPNKGKRILAIFALNGDSLRICYDLTGAKRPERFQTLRDSNLLLVLYKRLAEEKS